MSHGSPSWVRRLEIAEAATYRELMLEAYAAHPEAFSSAPGERDGLPLGWWEARFEPASGMVLGAFVAGKLVGALALAFEPRRRRSHQLHLIGLFVRQSARGRGLARELVEAAVAVARERPGCRTLHLTAIDGNDRALELYRRCGFEPWGTEPLAIEVDGELQGMVHLWRRVEGPA